MYTSHGYTERKASKYSLADQADCQDVGPDAAGSVFPETPHQVATWTFTGYPPAKVLGVRFGKDSFAVFVADSVAPEEREQIYEDLAADNASPDTTSTSANPTDGLRPRDDTESPQNTANVTDPTDGLEPREVPALADWDGRHYDFGVADNAERIPGGYVVEWDRYDLYTPPGPGGRIRHPVAQVYSRVPSEPWRLTIRRTEDLLTNRSLRVRPLTITESAWVYDVDQRRVRCRPNPPSWYTRGGRGHCTTGSAACRPRRC